MQESCCFYALVFVEETQFPKILEVLKVDDELELQLQYSGSSIPLPPCFILGHNANFISYRSFNIVCTRFVIRTQLIRTQGLAIHKIKNTLRTQGL